MESLILIVDDHDAVRASLRSWLAATFPGVVCIEAASGEEALALVRQRAPHLALMDIGLPGISGLEATARLKEMAPGTDVVIVSIHDNGSHRAAAEVAGASAYVAKQHMVAELSILLPRFLGQGGPAHPTPEPHAGVGAPSPSRAEGSAGPRQLRAVALTELRELVDIVASASRPGTAEWIPVAGEEAFLAELASGPDLVVAFQHGGSLAPETALEIVRRQGRDVLTVVVGRCDDEGAVMRYLELGAFDCLSPDRLHRVNAILAQAAERRRSADERERAQEALRASEARYRLIATNTSDGIFTLDRDGRVTFASPRWLQLGGYTEAEVLGRRMTDFVAEEYRGLAWERFNRSLGGEPAPLYVIELLGANGARRSVELSMSDHTDESGRVIGRIGVFRDVTERERAEKDRRRLVAAVEQASEAIVITDTRGCIQFVNPAFEALTGYSREEVLGENPRILKSDQQPAEVYREMWGTLLAGRIWRGRLVNRRKDGSLFEEEAVISPVRDGAGALVNFVAVKRNVTQEVALEAQLRQSQKMEIVGKLAGGVAHDFNNLLQAMLSHTQLLGSHSHDPEKVMVVARELEQHISHGASLARQLLLFSRREAVRLERLDLNTAVRNTTQMLRSLVRANIALAVELAPMELPVEVDRGQLEQVLMNLAVNASDAMPEGGTLTIRTGNGDEGHVLLAVEDTGHGIPEAIRERIFEPFFTTKGAEKGTGLGLSVVHGIVTHHGGRIEVDSTVGTGSTFKVMLPKAATGELPADEPVGAASPPLELGHGERILVVEDGDGIRDGITQILEAMTYEVVAVGNAEEALAAAAIRPFDALLTDLVLPGMDGAELAQRLLERFPALKVILMSGYAEDEALRRGSAAGHSRFLQKPFDMARLTREVRAALDGQPSTPGAPAE